MLIKQSIACFLSVISLIAVFPAASYGDSLSLKEAIDTAIKNRSELFIADLNIEKSKAEIDEARSDLYPKVDLVGISRYTKTIDKFEPTTFSFDFLGQSFTIQPTKNTPKYESDLSLGVTQHLFAGGRIVRSIESAKERMIGSGYIREANARDIVHSVVKAYWEMRRASDLSKIEDEKVRQSDAILDVATARLRAGTISGLEKEKAEVDLINSREDLIKAEAKRKIAVDDLLKEMGVIGIKEYSLEAADEPTYNPESYSSGVAGFIEMAMSKRPELLQLQRDRNAKEANVKVAKSGFYPQVDLAGEYTYAGRSFDWLDDSFEKVRPNYWSVFLTAKINIFEGFLTRSKVSQAKTEAASAQFEIEKKKQAIIQEIRKGYTSLTETRDRVKLAQENIVLAEKNLRAGMRQFELGVITIQQIAEYNISRAEAKKRYINSLIDYEKSKIELRWASGDNLL